MRVFLPFLSHEITISSGKKVQEKRSCALFVFSVLFVCAVISMKITGFRISTLVKRGGQFWTILTRMFPPDFSYLPSIWKPLLDTVKMSIIGSVTGSLLAFPAAAAASSNMVKNRAVVILFRFLFSLLRTIPTLITALVVTFIFGLGTRAGTTAIAVFTFSYVGKLLYEKIETVDMSPFMAMLSLGCTKTKAFILSVIPQVLPFYLSSCLYCFEGNMRCASVLGYVGAGGIGLILNSQIGLRNYPRVGMILVVLFFSVVITEHVSGFLRKRLLKGRSGSASMTGMTKEEILHSRGKGFFFPAVFAASLAVVLWSSSVLSGRGGSEVNSLAVAGSIIHGLFHPDTSLLFSLSTDGVPYLLLETLSIAFLGTFIGALISIPLAFLSSSNMTVRPVAAAVRPFVMAVRTVPAFVYGLMFIRVTGPGPFAGVLTMSVCSIGMISRVFSEVVEEMDRGILESLSAAGCSTLCKIRFGVIPQLASSFMSILIYRFDMNIRDTAVLGLVGAGGIGAPLVFAINGYKWSQAGAVLLGLVSLILVVEYLSSRIRTRLAGKRGCPSSRLQRSHCRFTPKGRP